MAAPVKRVHPRCRIACLALLGTLGLGAQTALGIGAPSPVNAGVPIAPAWTNAPSATFTWTAVAPDPGCPFLRYEGGLSGYSSFGAVVGANLPLSQGEQTFRVRAVQGPDPVNPFNPACPAPFETPGPDATLAVRVDQTPPSKNSATAPADGAVVDTTRPTFRWVPALDGGAPPSGIARYEIVISGGRVIATATGGTDATPGPNNALPVGVNVTWWVRSVDRAGNVSPLSTPPRVIRVEPTPPGGPPIIPGPGSSTSPSGQPSAGGGSSAANAGAAGPLSRARLPTRNAGRLRPRAGLVVPTTRPVLRWIAGPRRTTIYNVQVFRVMNPFVKRANAIQLDKVRSLFPRSRQVRVGRLSAGQCYVWRVWPYVATRFTSKPLGLSHFCVAAKPRPRR